MTNPLDLLRAAEFAEIKSDPIADHRFSSPFTREFVQSVIEGKETALRSGNRAGKTLVGSLLGSAFAIGVRKLDGRTIYEDRDGADPWTIDLPRMPVPNFGILIVPSYKQAQDASIAYYRYWLRKHDVKPVKGAMGLINELRVRPPSVKSMNEDDWTKISIYPRDGELPRGVEPHWIHADEPPSAETWGEARARKSAKHKTYRWLTFTPEHREEWEWLREDFGILADWKREITMSVFDNQALSKAQLDSIREEWANDPIKEARYYGAYVDLVGANPFKMQALHIERGLQEAKEPIRIEQAQVKVEAYTDRGVDLQEAYGDVFIWEDYDKRETYYIVGDPSLGVDDAEHDPCGMHVYTEGFHGPRRLVARYNGPIGAYGLGWLMAVFGERYGGAVVAPDMTGGYGGPVLTALSNYKSRQFPNGYPFIAQNADPMEPGEWKQPYGFTMDNVMKAEMIECVRWAILGGLVKWPSAATWRCFQEARMDRKGRLLKPKGVHYEDLTCAGHYCFRHFSQERLMGLRESAREHEQGRRRAHAAGGILPLMPFNRG